MATSPRTPNAPADSSAVTLQNTPAQVDDVTRGFPHALGPEKSILSSMLNDPQGCIGRAVEEGLTKEHFYLPGHGKLFAVMVELYEAGKEVELISLVQHLIDRGLLDSIGGPSAVTDLYTYAPNAGHFARHLAMVKDKFVLRSIIHSSNEAIARAYDNPDEVADLLDQVEADILGIRQGVQSGKDITVAKMVEDVFDMFEAMLSGDRGVQGVPTGYDVLDKMSNGLKPGEMFVIAARPSMGKTSLVMNIIEHICVDQGKPAMVFSCEMSGFQIVQRLVFSRARFALSQINKGYKPSKADLQKISRAVAEISKSRLFIDDTPNISINELRAKARRRKREDDIQLIAIDYLQLMKSRTRQAENSREREIAEISSGIKGLAKELNIPIIVLAQLNRGPETRTGKNVGVPRMSDLRESGSIEQDADLVGLLFRSAYYAEGDEEKAAEEGKAFLEIAKNRNGETGRVPLTFIAEHMRFETGPPANEVGA
jgi:replicative DNA helicase